MKTKAAAIALMAVCTALAMRWLWMFWTPRCNESCASKTVLGMYGLLAAAVLTTGVVVALVALDRWTVRRSLITFFIAAAALAACAIVLTP